MPIYFFYIFKETLDFLKLLLQPITVKLSSVHL